MLQIHAYKGTAKQDLAQSRMFLTRWHFISWLTADITLFCKRTNSWYQVVLWAVDQLTSLCLVIGRTAHNKTSFYKRTISWCHVVLKSLPEWLTCCFRGRKHSCYPETGRSQSVPGQTGHPSPVRRAAVTVINNFGGKNCSSIHHGLLNSSEKRAYGTI